jgi:hypothetical protein
VTLLIQRGNSHFCSDGTDPAILYESGAILSPALTPNTWGGPRNSASRHSAGITALKAVELVEAAQRAMAIGMPFNRHLTVHWEKSGLTDLQAAEATGRMLKLITDWARKKACAAPYAWVRENGPAKGSHVHILLHLPDGLAMSLTRRWYRAATKCRRPRNGAVKTRRIGGTASAAVSASEWYQANLAKLLHYLLKGVDEPTAKALGLDAWAAGGDIFGKRLSISSKLRA